MRTSSLFLALVPSALLVLGAPPAVEAQDADPVSRESEVGYELALHGSTASERGARVELAGIAYEVHGLADLRPTPGLELEVAITSSLPNGRGRERVSEARARSVEGGRFAIDLPMPARDLSSPIVELVVHRPGRPGRTFRFGLSQLASRALALLTDRNRYQPGETVRVWSLLRTTRGRAPVASAPLTYSLVDERGALIAERATETGPSGAASAEIEIPATAATGRWTVRVTSPEPGTVEASRSIDVVRRTVERLAIEVTLERELIEPGGVLRGRVMVTTPSGSPVRGAQVLVTLGDDDAPPLVLTTDDEGIAPIDAHAPSFLAGEVAAQRVVVRVTHAAHGSLAASAPYTMARTRWLVAATPEAGGLVPEVESELFLAIADPRGRPIAAGTELEVRGLGLRNGRATATTDGHGLASVMVRLPRGASARAQTGACAGEPSTTFEVEVRSTPLVVAPICARVAPEAQVLARVRAPVVAPGTSVEVELFRRPGASNRPVIIEALAGDRAIAFAWAGASARSVTLALPADVQGLLRIRARTLVPPDATQALDQPGATAIERGTIAAILVRPSDAFALEVTPDQELHRVRERAEIELRATVAPERGWVALLARDEAAHGGETDFALEWIHGEMREVLRGAIDPAHELYLRAAIAVGLPIDGGVSEPAPLVREPWDTGRPGSTSPALQGGVMRDPIAAREELRRRGLGPAMLAIERAVMSLGDDRSPERALLTRTVGGRVELHPDAIDHVVRRGHLHESQARTLGGQPLTVAMIQSVDPSFTFDRIARRVARHRLVRLLVGLARLADPDSAAALRASAGEPPERWLARLVQLGLVPADALIDPWGRPYALHRVARPAIVISARAVDHELASPGPDGRLGTADDVRDPFERAVPQRTPYAVISGEDRLLEQLSRLAPGERVLQAMAGAYARLGLAAEEERRAGPVTAATSESAAAEMPMQAAPPAAPAPEASGYAYEQGAMGGAAGGESRAEARRGRRRVAADNDADGILDSEDELEEDAERSPPGDRLAAMGELVREEFPATLFFVGEVALDAAGRARVTIPLADALTTYRLEAIGWSESGWISAGRGRVRVDQEAMVDAPVPPVARLGDVVRLPVRLQNRTREPLRARFDVALEGGLDLAASALEAVLVPPGEGVEVILELRPRSVGEGAMVLRALREDGTALDAVRRPMRIIEDARRVVERREELVRGGDVLTVEVPAQATSRGPGQLRIAVGGAIVGDPAVWASEGEPIAAAWSLAMAGRALPDAPRGVLLERLSIGERDDADWFGRYDPLELATMLGAAWHLPALDERGASAALRFLSRELPDPEQLRGVLPPTPAPPSAMLVALAPALRAAAAHPALREDLLRVIDRLRRLASTEGAQAEGAPATWARVAAGLGLTRQGRDDPRAKEMLRRVERHVFAVGDEAWLEPDEEDGSIEPRIEPTALLALARIADGDPDGALPLIRSIATVARGASHWAPQARALASAAAAMLTSGPVESIGLVLDGRTLDVAIEGGVATASLDSIGAPGSHRIALAMPRGALAIATLELRYAMPWDVRPAREAPIEIAWEGENGARDVRAALLLITRNRGARVLVRPVVEVELPAGAELDEPTREALTPLLASPPELEGATLRLRLRPMAPGGHQSIPLRLRWSVGGTLRGLGASAWDDASPPRADVRPVRVLPSREVVIPDSGAEPEPPDAEASEPPRPPPPPPPVLRPLIEVAR